MALKHFCSRNCRAYVSTINLKRLIDFEMESCNHDSLAYASALDLTGLIDLDMAQPTAALQAFELAHEVRAKVLPPGDAFFAASFVNIGLAFTELRRLDEAHEALQKSIDIRLRHDSGRIGNSCSNMASLLLRMGRPADAERMLRRCPALVNFNEETFLNTQNPRFVGYGSDYTNPFPAKVED